VSNPDIPFACKNRRAQRREGQAAALAATSTPELIRKWQLGAHVHGWPVFTAAGYVKGDPPGAEGFSEVDLNGNKDKLHLSPGLAEPHIPVDDVPALESAPQPLPPPEEIPDPERKAEVPKNTADAVAEAIKAATAIAKGTGASFVWDKCAC